MVDLDQMQKEVYQNKVDKGFGIEDNKENIYKQFCFIQGEVAEAFEAYHKGMDSLGEELADVCLYILGLCEIRGISLEKELKNKLEIIKKRKYICVNGAMVKAGKDEK